MREHGSLVAVEERIVVGLGLQVLALDRGNSQLRYVFIADPDTFAAPAQRPFGKPVPPGSEDCAERGTRA